MSKENDPVNVLHIPCNTPYVRKLQDEKQLKISNGRKLQSGVIPDEITYKWIDDHHDSEEFWSAFDVCHLHYGFEFEELELVKRVLEEIKKHRKKIVFTCHEISSVHGVKQEEYLKYLKAIVEASDSVITLTEMAKAKILETMQIDDGISVIPHGFVVDPKTEDWSEHTKERGLPPEVLLFGALRANRDTATSFINIALNAERLGCRVTLVTRPFTHQQLSDDPVLRTALTVGMGSSRTSVELSLPISDEEVMNRVKWADMMVLPYTLAGHSGQLELAYDCGVIPVFTNVGYFSSQRMAWPINDRSYGIEVDWHDGKEWLYQARLMQAIDESVRRVKVGSTHTDLVARREFRLREHQAILAAHLEIYNK